MHGCHVVVEGVHDDPERDISLVFGRPSREREPAVVLSEVANRGKQRGLADPRLSEHPQGAARASFRICHGPRRGSELLLAPDQLHERSLRRSRGPLEPTPWSIPGFPGCARRRSCSNVSLTPQRRRST